MFVIKQRLSLIVFLRNVAVISLLQFLPVDFLLLNRKQKKRLNGDFA